MGEYQNIATQALISPNGFLPVPMPPDALPGTVLVFAHQLHSRAAQRARALAQESDAARHSQRPDRHAATSFAPTPDALAGYRRLYKVMTGEIPDRAGQQVRARQTRPWQTSRQSTPEPADATQYRRLGGFLPPNRRRSMPPSPPPFISAAPRLARTAARGPCLRA